MRYSLILVLLCCTLTLSGTTYYIDPSGNNSNNGSSGSPWQTLAYACSKVTVSGDIIHINAGTYTVSSQISVPVGVSIEGEGMDATTIISTVTGGSTLYLASSSENTNGNQHISGIYFNGNNRTTPLAIMVYARGNISIYNNTFINYDQYGVRFEGGAGGARSTSVTYSTGNSFHDNVVTNCAYYSTGVGGGAALLISCQTGFLCYNNTVTQSRTTYTNGCGIKTGGWTKGFKIYNNTLTGDINSDKGHADSWDFAIEMWGDVGSITEGTEIYGNNIYNWEIDISGRITQKGSYDYGCSIHDNFIGCVNVPPVPKIGIWLEANTSLDYILIYKNHIKNVSKGIGFYATNQTPLPLFYNNISIYYNLIDNCGYNTTGNDQARGIWWSQASGTTNTVNNLKIYNNVITARTGGSQEVGIELDCLAGVTATNFEIKNNIVTGFDDAAVFTGLTGTIDYLAIQNNIFYNNGQSNAPKINITPGHYTNSGNLTFDPLFVSASDYHLQGTSPAINAGLNITTSITTDYYGAAIGSPPEIGASEYGSSGTVPVVPVYVSAAVSNATPSMLEMTYNSSLANIVPVTSAFSVLVNSTARTVSSVAISGAKVQLSLSSPVISGDVVSVAYSSPSVNPLQSSSAGIVASISAKTVTNGVTAAIPVYVSSAIASSAPSLLEMTYNMSLTNIIPAASSFSVLVNSVTRTVNSVAISGTKVQLTLASPVVNGDVVTVSYTKPAVNPLQTASAGIAASVSAKTVTNGVTAAIPVYVSSAIANATPSLLEMTYNMSLTNIIPAASSFSVLVNSVTRTVNSVAISGTKVQLTLARPVVNGDVVTVSYTKPAVNPLQTASAGIAASVSAKTVTNGVTAAIPVYVSSAIANATPSLLEMTYNMSLTNIIPATSSFSVLVNSATRTVNSVAISGTKVQLTLARPVVNGDVVTVSYTKPSVNPLQTASAGIAASVSAKTVTNGVTATIPVYVTSGIANATPTLLEITYNMSLANIIPAASAFSVLVNSVARTVNTIVISGSKVQLTLASPVVNSDVVTISYTKPAVNPLQTPSAGIAASIGAQTVAVGVIAVVPVYVSSTVADATPSLLEMSYNTSLANIVPAPSSFTILVNSVSRTVNMVVVTGTKVQLTMTNPIVPGDVITVSYVQPSINPLQTTTGGKAVSVTSKSVINNCINLAPTAVITSPVTAASFASPANITITADVFDTDGTVSLVEFYNGITKIGSSLAAPYSFTWNNVLAGNYTLTVVATDNLNAKTISSAILISVTASTQASNRHPFIKISNPRKGISYDNMSSIEIDAVASDPDGTISMVEFYNGTEKLVELTSAPYTYIWKDVLPGSYSITAIATDNLGDTTASEPIEFVVGSRVKYDANSEMINLYPNPSDGHFSIDFVNPILNDKGEIIITDLAGKQVYRGPVLREELTKQFDLSDFKSGIYVMIVKDKDILVTKKIIKN